MKVLILNFFGVLILFGLITCTNDPVTVTDKTLVNTKWDLQSFEIIDVAESAIGSQGIIVIFMKDSSLEGESKTIEGDLSVPGNSYGSVYEAGIDGSLYIDVVGSTKAGRPPGSRYDEYLEALHNSSSYEIEGNKLRIFYDGGTKALNFKAE